MELLLCKDEVPLVINIIQSEKLVTSFTLLKGRNFLKR